MRIARKLALLTVMALAAMAFAASSASADSSVTVNDEQTGDQCDPCLVHAVGESSLTAFHFIRISQCEDEFVAAIESDGSGVIHDYTNVDDGGPGCTRQNCNEIAPIPNEEIGESEWPISSEETGPNAGEMEIDFCLDDDSDPDALGTHCLADVAVTESTTVEHHYSFAVNQECTTPSAPVRVTGNWETEGPIATEGTDIEIVH